MSQQGKAVETRLDEYWSWFSVALFLLVTVDLLTTMGATAEVGIEAEANPLMAWLLQQGPSVLTIVNLGAVVLGVYAFSGVVEAVRLAPAPYDRYLEYAVEVWLGILLGMGLVIFANNLTVIVYGHSLL